MTLQSDTNLRIQIIVDDNTSQQGLIKLQTQNGNIVLSFYPEIETNPNNPRAKRISQVPDYVFHLCDYTMLRINPNDKLSFTLESPRSIVLFIFSNEQDVIYLLRFITTHVKILQTDINPYIYLFLPYDVYSDSSVLDNCSEKALESKKDDEKIDFINENGNSIQSNRAYFEDLITDHPFSSTILPPLKPHACYSILKTSHFPDLLFIDDFKDSQIESHSFTNEDFEKLFDEEGKLSSNEFPFILYNKQIEKKLLSEVLEYLLFPSFATMTPLERKEYKKQNLESFLQCKKIWKSTSLSQWKYFTELRLLVQNIEDDLDRHESLFAAFEHPKCVQKIAFEILLTLSYWKWDTDLYVNGLVTFLLPILNSFIKDALIDFAITYKDEKVSIDEIESEIFWCFSNFYDQNNLNDSIHTEKQPILRSLFNSAGDTLNSEFPDIRSILDQKHAFSLDFMINDFRLWFTNCFQNIDDVQRLWISCLSFSDTYQFFQYFLIAIIYSLAPNISQFCVLSSKEFEVEFHKLKTQKFNLNLFLHNTLVLKKNITIPSEQ